VTPEGCKVELTGVMVYLKIVHLRKMVNHLRNSLLLFIFFTLYYIVFSILHNIFLSEV